MKKILFRGVFFGALSSLVLLGFYFLVLNLVSGSSYALSQFETYKFYILTLSAGFGIQIGLYTYLKNLVKNSRGTAKAAAISGTTSTVAMISCCSHYLANILPIIGVTGIISLIGQYQIEIFWVGLFANILGIIYMGRKVISLSSHEPGLRA